MLSIVKPSIDKLIITQADHPRSMDSRIIEKFARKSGFDYVVADTVADSLNIAVDNYQENSILLAAGSIFIAGEVKQKWHSYMERNKQ